MNDADQPRHRVAAIDIGTVSSRLSLAEVAGGRVLAARKHTEITDLGQGVDATGRFAADAVARVVDACRVFVDEARAFGAEAVSTTLTSAARDAANAEELLGPLRELGLIPQVIPGEVEARLTFYGVAHDFPGERIAVADSGGGSTEIAVGSYLPESGVLELERVQSLDIGCRRVTDRFLAGDPPCGADILRAGRWAAEQFEAYWCDLPDRPERLVAVGGTVTTLVALTHELVPRAMARARTYATWYLKGMPHAAAWRGRVVRCASYEEFCALVDEIEADVRAAEEAMRAQAEHGPAPARDAGHRGAALRAEDA